MTNRRKYILAVAAVATAAGFGYIKSSHRNIPADLRDAPSASSAMGSLNSNSNGAEAEFPAPNASGANKEAGANGVGFTYECEAGDINGNPSTKVRLNQVKPDFQSGVINLRFGSRLRPDLDVFISLDGGKKPGLSVLIENREKVNSKGWGGGIARMSVDGYPTHFTLHINEGELYVGCTRVQK